MSGYSKAWRKMDLPRWNRLRNEVVRERGAKCQECGSDFRIEVHHVKPLARRPDLAYVKSNLRVLCRRHHLMVDMTPSRKAFFDMLDTMQRR